MNGVGEGQVVDDDCVCVGVAALVYRILDWSSYYANTSSRLKEEEEAAEKSACKFDP